MYKSHFISTLPELIPAQKNTAEYEKQEKLFADPFLNRQLFGHGKGYNALYTRQQAYAASLKVSVRAILCVFYSIWAQIFLPLLKDKSQRLSDVTLYEGG